MSGYNTPDNFLIKRIEINNSENYTAGAPLIVLSGPGEGKIHILHSLTFKNINLNYNLSDFIIDYNPTVSGQILGITADPINSSMGYFVLPTIFNIPIIADNRPVVFYATGGSGDCVLTLMYSTIRI